MNENEGAHFLEKLLEGARRFDEDELAEHGQSFEDIREGEEFIPVTPSNITKGLRMIWYDRSCFLKEKISKVEPGLLSLVFSEELPEPLGSQMQEIEELKEEVRQLKSLFWFSLMREVKYKKEISGEIILRRAWKVVLSPLGMQGIWIITPGSPDFLNALDALRG